MVNRRRVLDSVGDSKESSDNFFLYPLSFNDKPYLTLPYPLFPPFFFLKQISGMYVIRT